MSFDTTELLGLPCIMPAQAQKHVTHNEALRRLDALVQLAVRSRSLAAPPPAPAPGDRHIVAAGAGGAWAGHEGEIAAWLDGAWTFFTANAGWRAWLEDEQKLLVRDAGSWRDIAPEQAPKFGINTGADTANRLAVKSDAALFTHDDQTPGSGDMRVTIDKAATGNTAALIFQTAAAGRAELGLAGNDDFTLKVSTDGETWKEALLINKDSGTIRLPNGLVNAQTLAPLSSLMFAPLIGTGQNSIYRVNTSHTQHPRTATIASISGGTITLTDPTADVFFLDSYMSGTVYIRIWNISKSPAQSAWIAHSPSANQLSILDVDSIFSWVSNDIVQIGDPHTSEAERAIAVDISPLLTLQFGTAFPQAGVVLTGGLFTAGTAGDALRCSPNKLLGSYATIARAHVSGVAAESMATAPCNVPSPISNSNLLFLQETFAGTATVSLANVIGVFG